MAVGPIRQIKKVRKSIPRIDGAGVRLNRTFGFHKVPQRVFIRAAAILSAALGILALAVSHTLADSSKTVEIG